MNDNSAIAVDNGSLPGVHGEDGHVEATATSGSSPPSTRTDEGRSGADGVVEDFGAHLAGLNEQDRKSALSRARMLAMQKVPDEQLAAQPVAKLLRQRVKLGNLLRRGVEPPSFLPSPTLGERLFYVAHMFLFAGHKKAGKSWAMTILARDQIAEGQPVVYVDNENGAELFAERLALVGVDPDAADEHLHYVPFPTDLTSPEDLRGEFEAIAEAVPGAFVVLDSLRTFMSRFGLDPNKDVDVERFLGPIMGAVKNAPAERRPTVCVIDHSNRATRESDDYAAAGSFAKPAAVDAVYYFDRQAPFNRDVEGVVKIAVKDDRRGLLDFERFYRIGGQGDGRPLYFERADSHEVGTAGRIRRDVRAALARTAELARLGNGIDGSMSKRELRTEVKGDSGEIGGAADALVDDPTEPVFPVPGRGGSVRYRFDPERFAHEGKPGAGIGF